MMAAALWIVRALIAAVGSLAAALFGSILMALANEPIGIWLFLMIWAAVGYLIFTLLDIQSKARN